MNNRIPMPVMGEILTEEFMIPMNLTAYYLTLLRVEKAKELLASTNLTIRDISVQVGYYDSGSFIRRFKQVAGETPQQYRRSRGADTAKENSHEDK